MTTVVDGNNVMGSVPDGWWRDRPGAVRRLLGRLQRYAEGSSRDVVLVLDVPQADLPAGPHDGVEVVYPRRKGRNAADDRILELLDDDLAGRGTGDGGGGDRGDEVEVVTSDRGLAAGVADRGVAVVGARTFLTRLDDAGC
jgi:predicted RNA-binding protein with PIN domain